MVETFAAIFALALVYASGAAESPYRLPKTVTPYQYELTLDLDPNIETYNGAVNIRFNDNNSSNPLTDFYINANPTYITINEVLLNIYNCNSTANATTDIVHITCPENSDLGYGNYFIIRFNASYPTTYRGMYRTSYIQDGVEEFFIATQFEPARARMAFPCFDEPQLKATFKATINVPNEYFALFNTPLLSATAGVNTTTYQFIESPIMSTYLVAIVVSKFTKSGNISSGYDYAVYSRPDRSNATTMAANYGPKLLDLLGNLTGIAYQDLGLNKSDQVAVPRKSGAMENWGLITYLESWFLDDGSSQTSKMHKQLLVTVMAHELAHQWFGDYVTLEWWSQTWVNEGFAEYFQYYIANELEEDLELDKQFVIEILQSVLISDASSSSQPLTSEEDDINTAAEYSSKFGDITYYKGASVIRMLRYLLGDVSFKEALNTILVECKHSTANTSIILDTMDKYYPNISTYAENWFYKPGYPVLNVVLHANGKTISLTQERFLLSANGTETDTTQWYIPISYTTSTGTTFDVNFIEWLQPDSNMSVTINEDDWVIFNLQQSGFYRVNYDATLWQRITTTLRNASSFKDIHVLNRAQLIDDAFNLAKAGKLSYSIFFELYDYLENEEEYYPWYAALKAFSFLRGKAGDTLTEEALQNVTSNLLAKVIEFPTPNNQTHTKTLKDVLILTAACKLGNSDCTTYAEKAFSSLKEAGTRLEPNLREVILCSALRTSTNSSQDWDYVYQLFQNSTSEYQRTEFITALGCVNDETVLQKYLLHIINNQSSFTKDYVSKVFIAASSGNPTGLDIALNFLQSNLTDIVNFYNDSSTVSGFVTNIAQMITTIEQIQVIESIKNNTIMSEVREALEQAIEVGNSNLQWIERNREALRLAFFGTENISVRIIPLYSIIILMASLLIVSNIF